MKYLKTIALLVLVPLVALAKPLDTAELKITEAPYTIQANYFAELYGVDGRIVNKVLDCESDYNHEIPGDGGRSKGIAQIQKPTWNWMEQEYFNEYGEHLDYKSSHDQIKLLAYQISKGHGNNWTTFRAIKNGGKYSFWSSQNNRHYIVFCKI